jgi:hypothetical protein
LRIGVAAALLALVIPGPSAGPAAASVNVASDMHGVYDGCIAKIRSAGLGAVVDKLDNSKFTFKVVRTDKHGNTHTEADDNTDKRDGTGTGGTLYWYPGDKVTYADGIQSDDCATLYHEMSHLSDYADGASRDDVPTNCGPSTGRRLTAAAICRPQARHATRPRRTTSPAAVAAATRTARHRPAASATATRT